MLAFLLSLKSGSDIPSASRDSRLGLVEIESDEAYFERVAEFEKARNALAASSVTESRAEMPRRRKKKVRKTPALHEEGGADSIAEGPNYDDVARTHAGFELSESFAVEPVHSVNSLDVGSMVDAWSVTFQNWYPAIVTAVHTGEDHDVSFDVKFDGVEDDLAYEMGKSTSEVSLRDSHVGQ